MDVDAPAGINALPRRALLELLERDGPQVAEVVGAGARDDLVPDDGLARAVGVLAARIGPLGRDVDKDLLGVPGEEAREVGVEGEADDGVFFLFGAVVVRPAFDTVVG